MKFAQFLIALAGVFCFAITALAGLPIWLRPVNPEYVTFLVGCTGLVGFYLGCIFMDSNT